MQLKNTVKSMIENSGDQKREKRRLIAIARLAEERKSVFTIINTVLMFSRTLLLMKKIVKLEIAANSTRKNYARGLSKELSYTFL